ncbi:hypothetical protein SCHPADRAFT_286583 [Schizopora paradoxa]|uniref:Uncharacterized protein n=1 Tax=Schizopora paradoxa TaxID=27342 RepID=A0A0H2RT09_9AGAM|nr:hypothetical protein SCHPADRAFT_286583 [Schizopora paradoxa]
MTVPRTKTMNSPPSSTASNKLPLEQHTCQQNSTNSQLWSCAEEFSVTLLSSMISFEGETFSARAMSEDIAISSTCLGWLALIHCKNPHFVVNTLLLVLVSSIGYWLVLQLEGCTQRLDLAEKTCKLLRTENRDLKERLEYIMDKYERKLLDMIPLYVNDVCRDNVYLTRKNQELQESLEAMKIESDKIRSDAEIANQRGLDEKCRLEIDLGILAGKLVQLRRCLEQALKINTYRDSVEAQWSKEEERRIIL